MKRNLTFLAVVLFAVALASCSKKSSDEGFRQPAADGWELVSWNGNTDLAGYIYLQFDAGRFTLYQHVGTLVSGYTQYTGTYTLAEDPAYGTLLSGSYSDGTPWARSYVVESWTEKELRMRSLDEAIVSVYGSVVIPARVKEEPIAFPSRGVAEEPFL